MIYFTVYPWNYGIQLPGGKERMQAATRLQRLPGSDGWLLVLLPPVVSGRLVGGILAPLLLAHLARLPAQQVTQPALQARQVV
jgi:hypothetical protein